MSKITSASSSTKLRKIYDSLPPEAQKQLVDKHFSALLSSLPKENAKRVVSSATRLQKRYLRTPNIDIISKKKEIRSLLSELRRDSKRAAFTRHSSDSARGEILSEIVESLTNWIQVIWRVVYEHKVNFSQAHSALLYIWEVVMEIGVYSGPGPGGCKCSIAALPVDLTIRSSSGKLIKRFGHRKIENVDKVLLWVWRELFVSMLAASERQGKKQIPEMLLDIEDTLGWRSLILVLRGGSKGYQDEDDEDSEEEDEDEDDDDDDEDEDEDSSYGASDDLEDEYEEQCTCGYHASHWSYKINEQRLSIRDLVISRLHDLFSLEPSVALYIAIMGLSEEPNLAAKDLMQLLSTIATFSSPNFAAALGIYASEGDTEHITKLLDTHAHLLRPQDSNSYQAAVLALSEEIKYRPRALKIVETELNETVHYIRLLVQSCFKGIEEETHKAELKSVLRLAMASQQRIDRVNSWVEAITTQSAGPPGAFHPAQLVAAMMMGIPPPGLFGGMDDADESDLMGLLEDPNDPDLEDFREQLRPRLRNRFKGWEGIALAIKGGASLLTKVYSKMTEDMPFLAANDVTEAMIMSLEDRPTKEHVMDCLEEMLAFVKEQKRKKAARQKKRSGLNASASKNSSTSANTGKASLKRSDTNTNTQGSGSTSAGAGSGSGGTNTFSFSFGLSGSNGTPMPQAQAQAPTYGGLDDVD